MQRRPTGALPGGRRAYSYGSYAPQAGPPQPPPPQQQAQQQQQYLPTTGMYGGVGMTMSNMESSLRGGYGQPQPPPQQQQQPLRYWSVDQSQQVGGAYNQQGGAAPYGKASPSNAGGLDLELGDILESSGNAGSGAASASFAAAGDPAGPGGDMFGVASSFQPSPVAVPAPQQQQQQQAPASAPASQVTPAPRARASRSRKAAAAAAAAASSSAGGASSSSSVGPAGVKKAPPTAAASSLLDEPPDLSTRKLDDKTEKCQYAGCPNRARVEQKYGKFCNRHVIVAPCGFPGCRDKALERASMCERHAVEGKDALHRILAARAQNVPVCRTYGCFKNDQGRGYCRGHEKLLMATGRLPKHVNRRRVNNAYTMCAYPACTKHSQRNHLCRTHGNLVMKQAEELAARAGSSETFDEVLARLQKDIRRCSHPACTKNSQRDRLCTIHYYEKHNLGPVGGTSGGGGGGGGKRRAASRSRGSAVADDDDDDGDADVGMAEDFENSAAVGNAIRDVERTRCLAPGCGHAVAFAGGLCALHAKQQQSVR